MSVSGVDGGSGRDDSGPGDHHPGDHHPGASAGELSIVLAGGGTAGHVEPAMAVADALIGLNPTLRITALGTARGLENRLVPARGYLLRLVPAVPLPRKLNADLIRLPWRVRASVAETETVLDEVNADVVVGFGGYVAVPAYPVSYTHLTLPTILLV